MNPKLFAIVVALLVASLAVSQNREKRVVPVDPVSRKTFERQVKIALLVGIGSYSSSSGLPGLKYPARDVEVLGAELERQGYLVRRLADSEATRGAVRRALIELTAALDPDQGTFMFYFSGHGFQQQDGANYLATYGSSADDLKGEGLAVSDVEALLKNGRARQSIMFIDACRNDPSGGAKAGGVRSFGSFNDAQGLRVLYSTRSGRVSYESDEFKQGVFTYYLARGLRGDAAGVDGLVTFRDLADYVIDQARAYGIKQGQVQVPYESGESSGDFLLARASSDAVDAPPQGAIGINFPADENISLLKAYGSHQGVFVQFVDPDGPAGKGGLKSEDIITAVNGKPIANGADLVDIITKTLIGSTVRLTALRNRQPVTLQVVVGSRAKIFPSTAATDPSAAVPDKDMDFFQRFFGATSISQIRSKFGIVAKPLDRATPKLDFTGQGLAVTWIDYKSFGSVIGLQRDDVIQSINGQSFKTLEEAENIVKALKDGQSVAMRIARRDESDNWLTMFVAGDLPKAK